MECGTNSIKVIIWFLITGLRSDLELGIPRVYYVDLLGSGTPVSFPELSLRVVPKNLPTLDPFLPTLKIEKKHPPLTFSFESPRSLRPSSVATVDPDHRIKCNFSPSRHKFKFLNVKFFIHFSLNNK